MRNIEKFKESHTRPDRLVTSLFNSPDYIRKNVNPDELMWGLYWIASDLQNVEIEVSLYDVFQEDELFDLWQVCNYHNYVCDGPAPANGGIMTASARSLLEIYWIRPMRQSGPGPIRRHYALGTMEISFPW